MSFPQQRWLYSHQLFDSMSSIFQEATHASVITCCTDVLWPLPRLELQIVHQCPHRKSSQWVRITLVGWDCKVNGDNVVSHSAKWLKRFRWRVSIDWVSHSPAMRPMTPDVLMTSPACMFSVAMIHLFRLPPATNAMSADLKTQMVKNIYIYLYLWGVHQDRHTETSQRRLSLPAGVVPHFHNLLFKGLAAFSIFIVQPLEVYHSISLLVAAANSMSANPPCIVHSEMVSSQRQKRKEKWKEIKKLKPKKIFFFLFLFLIYFHFGTTSTKHFTCVISASSLFHPYGSDGILVYLLPQCPVLLKWGCGEKAPALSDSTGHQAP